MATVSRMYYKQKLTKQEIAQRLRISRFQVARLLDQAEAHGIVRIEIVPPASFAIDVEQQLEKTFNLGRAVVVSPISRDEEEIKVELGRVAAQALQQALQPGDILGVAWGTTVNEVVKALPAQVGIENVTVVQITGGVGRLEPDIQGIDLAQRVAQKLGAPCYLFYAPAVVQTPEARQILLADEGIRHTVAMFDRITVALVGIGAWAPEPVSSFLRTGYITEQDLAHLQANQVVGDMYNHFFDIHGQFRDGELADRLMAMTIEQIQRVPLTIAVAGGLSKRLAILGALRSGLVNWLITDQPTAEAVLELAT